MIKTTQKQLTFEQVTQEVLDKGKAFSDSAYEAVSHLFKTDFLGKFRKRIEKQNPNMVKSKEKITTLAPQPQNESNTERRIIDFSVKKAEIR